MLVKDLLELFKDVDGDMEVVFRPTIENHRSVYYGISDDCNVELVENFTYFDEDESKELKLGTKVVINIDSDYTYSE